MMLASRDSSHIAIALGLWLAAKRAPGRSASRRGRTPGWQPLGWNVAHGGSGLLGRYVAGMVLVGLLACSQTPVRLIGPPVTVSVAVPESARRSPHLLLHVEGILRSKEGAVVCRVFAGNPAATAATAVDDPSYVGVLTLLPNRSAPNQTAKNVTLPVPAALARRLQAKTQVAVTLVPEARLAGAGVRIERIRFEAAQ